MDVLSLAALNVLEESDEARFGTSTVHEKLSVGASSEGTHAELGGLSVRLFREGQTCSFDWLAVQELKD